ncbi:MAG: Do family serine endopeptidase [Rubrivivax sp.]|nr:Do family serine endopeptidase [Rubrivivax sp.]
MNFQNRLVYRPLVAALAAAGLLSAGAAGAWSVKGLFAKAEPTPMAAATAPATVAPVAPLPAGSVPNFRAIVRANGPAVVGVTVSGSHKVSMPDMSEDPFFRFFRGMPGFQGGPGGPHGGEQPFRGQGSGFIVSSDGIVLTNAHVVREAKEVTVKLQDRREFRAKVLGADADSDVAVLKIDATGLPAVTLGDASQAQVGDPVLAIGAPYGLEQSATQGIVSAKGRSLPGDSFVPFIQTDAAVNPGNSGGPLFDGAGRVIGINSQIYSQSGGFQGLAFAIPIDVAMNVKDQIVQHGKVEHARMGVTLQDLSQPLAQSFGLKQPDGALVAQVLPGSAAAKAGLKPGDVIVQMDGQSVATAGDVSSRVGQARPGDALSLGIWRDKEQRDVTVKLGRAEDLVALNETAADEPGALGVSVRPLTPQERQQADTDHGLLVQQVSGAAAHAGLQPGDIVLALNGKPVNAVGDVRSVLDKKPGHVALLIQREDQRIFVPVDLRG